MDFEGAASEDEYPYQSRHSKTTRFGTVKVSPAPNVSMMDKVSSGVRKSYLAHIEGELEMSSPNTKT